MSASAEGLELVDVQVDYGAVTAVDGVDLGVERGTVLALLGPSGCGKSTVLRAIAGLEPIVRGAVRWQGRDLTAVPVHQRGIGMMFQDHALFPHRSVAENVAFGLRMRGVPRRERSRRADEMLEMVGLAGTGARSVGTLSGGQAQRVALARALAPAPDLLLLDEPLAALDRSLRERLVAEIREIVVELGVTAVHVTHDHDEAASIGDTVALMDGGRIRATGVLGELVAAPGDVATAELLGLDTIWRRTVMDGSVVTPWGPVPTTAATGSTAALLLPVDAVRVIDVDVDADGHDDASAGIVAGQVISSRARAGAWLVRIGLGDGSTVVAAHPMRLAERSGVGISADLARFQLLADPR